MKLNVKFLLLLILLNGIAVAGCVVSSTSWFVALSILVLGNVTAFHKRSQRIQQELVKADVDGKIEELVAAENASRRLLKEVLATARSQSSKLKKHDETLARLHTELSRHRGGQQKRNQLVVSERDDYAAILPSARKDTRTEGPSDTSEKTPQDAGRGYV